MNSQNAGGIDAAAVQIRRVVDHINFRKNQIAVGINKYAAAGAVRTVQGAGINRMPLLNNHVLHGNQMCGIGYRTDIECAILGSTDYAANQRPRVNNDASCRRRGSRWKI